MNQLYIALLTMLEIIEQGEDIDGIVSVKGIPAVEIRSNFGELHEKSLKQKIDTYRAAIEGKMCSVEFAIEKVFGDQLDDESLIRLIIETKIEFGLPLSEEQKKYSNYKDQPME